MINIVNVTTNSEVISSNTLEIFVSPGTSALNFAFFASGVNFSKHYAKGRIGIFNFMGLESHRI